MKRTILCLLALVLCLGLVLMSGSAKAEATQLAMGTWGDCTLRWMVYSDGRMVIEGNDAIRDRVTSVPRPFEEYVKQITSVEFIGRVYKIGNCAFEGFTSLKRIVIPRDVTSIGYWAFDGCESLEEMILPNAVKTINASAFYGCTSLKRIWIPKANFISPFAFDECTSLTDIYYAGTKEEWETTGGLDEFPGKNWGITTIHYGAGASAAITAQPEDVIAKIGSTAKFTVSASGLNLTYRWQYSEDGGSTWSNSTASGYNTAALSFTVRDKYIGRMYRCIVSNDDSVAASSAATLKKAVAPTITTQPKTVSAKIGSTAKFTVSASGTGLKYKWQYSKDGGSTWSNSSSTGYNTATLSITVKDTNVGRKYRCIVSNDGGKVTSSAATLKKAVAPTITTQPKTVSAKIGATAKFTVAASGSSLKYQWQYSKDGGSTWSNSSSTGYNTATLSVTVKDGNIGRKYRCIVSNTAGKVTSSAATLKKTAAPVITTQPPKTFTGTDGKAVIISVVASGSDLIYQWQYSDDGGTTWIDGTGRSAATPDYSVSVTAAKNGRYYRCVVKNGSGKATSTAAKLVVAKAPTITTQPQTVKTKVGATAQFTVAASGKGLKYQWQYSKDGGSTWINSTVSSANSAALTFKVKDTFIGRRYRCIVSNSAGKVTSAAAILRLI